MTAIRFAASTVLGLIAATSAFAAEPEVAAPATATVAAGTAATTTVTPAAKPRKVRYCIRSEAVTGSRLPRIDCNTRGNWKAMGVDIDTMIANSRR